jgi:hypothetical protein
VGTDTEPEGFFWVTWTSTKPRLVLSWYQLNCTLATLAPFHVAVVFPPMTQPEVKVPGGLAA